MAVPLAVQFRHVRAARALEAAVRVRFDRLSHYCPTILDGRVVIERTGLRHQSGQRYRVQIVLSLPGADVVVDHERDHVLPDVAIHDAFAAARRRLQDRVRRQRNRVPARRARTVIEA